MKALTDRQQELLSFIEDFGSQNGIMPSLPEIADHFSYSSKAAWDAVEALVRKGYLEKDKGGHRSIKLSSSGRALRENVRIPIYENTITAERLANEADSYIYIWKALAGSRSLFAVRVSSLSMKNAGILPGDIAVLERPDGTVSDSDIVLAKPKAADDSSEMELRRYRKTPLFSELWPENDSMGIIKAPEFSFYGKLILVLRSY